MHTHADSAASVIREAVPLDEIVRSRTADAGIEFPVRAHPLENIVLHHRPGRVIVREHADTAAVFKAAFFHRNPVGISDSDDIRPDGAGCKSAEGPCNPDHGDCLYAERKRRKRGGGSNSTGIVK